MKLKHFAAIGAAFALAFSGCTTTKSGGVSYDAEANTTIVNGKETTIAPLVGPVRTLFLKAEISPGNTGLYLVVLYLSVDGWLLPDQVSDSSGKGLEGFQGTKETLNLQFGKVTKEIYYIPLTRQYLEAHRKSGINLRLTGSNGTLAAAQPGSFVTDFLASLDATKTKLAGSVPLKKLVANRNQPYSSAASQ
jgi:hypothetical protein